MSRAAVTGSSISEALNHFLMCPAFAGVKSPHSRASCRARGDAAAHAAVMREKLAAREARSRLCRDVRCTPSPRGSMMVQGTPQRTASSKDSSPLPPATSTTPEPRRRRWRPNSRTSKAAKVDARLSFLIFCQWDAFFLSSAAVVAVEAAVAAAAEFCSLLFVVVVVVVVVVVFFVVVFDDTEAGGDARHLCH